MYWFLQDDFIQYLEQLPFIKEVDSSEYIGIVNANEWWVKLSRWKPLYERTHKTQAQVAERISRSSGMKEERIRNEKVDVQQKIDITRHLECCNTDWLIDNRYREKTMYLCPTRHNTGNFKSHLDRMIE